MRSSRIGFMGVLALGAIGSIGSSVISAEGGWNTEPKPHPRRGGKYTPHQGKKECARRLRRLQAGKAA